MTEKNRVKKLMRLNELRDKQIERLEKTKALKAKITEIMQRKLVLPNSDETTRAEIASFQLSLQRLDEAIEIIRIAIMVMGKNIITLLKQDFPILPKTYHQPKVIPAKQIVKKQKKCCCCIIC